MHEKYYLQLLKLQRDQRWSMLFFVIFFFLVWFIEMWKCSLFYELDLIEIDLKQIIKMNSETV